MTSAAQHECRVNYQSAAQFLETDLCKQYQGFSISQVNERENESRIWTLPQGTQWK